MLAQSDALFLQVLTKQMSLKENLFGSGAYLRKCKEHLQGGVCGRSEEQDVRVNKSIYCLHMEEKRGRPRD